MATIEERLAKQKEELAVKCRLCGYEKGAHFRTDDSGPFGFGGNPVYICPTSTFQLPAHAASES